MVSSGESVRLNVAQSRLIGGETFPLTASEAVPAAAGKVEVKKDKNGNTGVTIKTEHLAKPDRLTPPATIYVVWFQERNGEPVGQGALKVKKDLTGEFEDTTALSTFDVLSTAEGVVCSGI